MKAFLIFSLILFVILVISYICYFIVFYNVNHKDVTHELIKGEEYEKYNDKVLDSINKALEIPYKECYIQSSDRAKLYVREYIKNINEPFHIQFHGYKGNGIRDFSGGLRLALELNHNVILIDQRACGKSTTNTITFGINEGKDVLEVINYVIDKYGKKTEIFLDGISLGAATVLMSINYGLPKNVIGIIADCPYSSPYEIIDYNAYKMTKLKHVFMPFIVIGAFLYGGFNLLENSAIKAVKNSKIKILLIHGKADTFVPYYMSEKIKEANPDYVTLVGVDNAPHAMSFIENEKLYKESFIKFVDECLIGE